MMDASVLGFAVAWIVLEEARVPVAEDVLPRCEKRYLQERIFGSQQPKWG